MSLRDWILRLSPPARRANMEAESRKWIATCPRCQSRNSMWDVGGMRYGGFGRPTSLVRCTNCGKISPHRFEKKG
jgi:DNA-directed RNA polymerase subunit M/transcription elongation factor TFIIS